jgi:hypothetical protein
VGGGSSGGGEVVREALIGGEANPRRVVCHIAP